VEAAGGGSGIPIHVERSREAEGNRQVDGGENSHPVGRDAEILFVTANYSFAITYIILTRNPVSAT
jgi:hypothetical protein